MKRSCSLFRVKSHDTLPSDVPTYTSLHLVAKCAAHHARSLKNRGKHLKSRREHIPTPQTHYHAFFNKFCTGGAFRPKSNPMLHRLFRFAPSLVRTTSGGGTAASVGLGGGLPDPFGAVCVGVVSGTIAAVRPERAESEFLRWLAESAGASVAVVVDAEMVVLRELGRGVEGPSLVAPAVVSGVMSKIEG